METLNNGKPYYDSLGDIDYSIKCIEYYAGWTDKICGKTIPVGKLTWLKFNHRKNYYKTLNKMEALLLLPEENQWVYVVQ